MLFIGIIALDAGMLSLSLQDSPREFMIFYLLGTFAFSGLVDVLRARESRRVGARSWRLTLIIGAINLALAIFAGVFGFVLKNRYCILYLRRRPRLQRDHAYHFCISPDRDCLYPVDTKKHWQDYAPVCIISRKSKGALREKEFLSERLFAR